MNIHEHQAKDLLKNYGANVSNGVVILSEEEITKKISLGKISKFKEDNSLMTQDWVMEPKKKVKDIMTPFSVMKIADQNSTITDFYNQNNSLEFSRIPIYYQNSNKISSYVLKDTILEKMIQKKGDLKLNDIKRKIIKIDQMSKMNAFNAGVEEAQNQNIIFLNENDDINKIHFELLSKIKKNSVNYLDINPDKLLSLVIDKNLFLYAK